MKSDRLGETSHHMYWYSQALPARVSILVDSVTQFSETMRLPSHMPLFKYRRPILAKSRAVAARQQPVFSSPSGA